MPTNDHTLWNAALTALVAVVGFFLRAFHLRVEEAHKHLAETRETLLRDFVEKDHIEQRFDRLEAKLDRIIEERNTKR